ncbi:YndM family protein [Oceanobacillus sp. FSL K6-2867]|uniref:YndM family protein n=1 Tax=Oceanobacillus sp. FSL K6-2867 TaxID=2954748 RepID=UPI0030DA06D5
MKYIGPLIIKFILTTVIVSIVLGLFFNVSFAGVVTTSVLLTGLAFLGDVLVLPLIEKSTALIGDFFLAWVVVLFIGNMLFNAAVPIGSASFTTAAAVIAGEVFFHRYMRREVLRNVKNSQNKVVYLPKRYFQTEFSSELDKPDDPTNHDKK